MAANVTGINVNKITAIKTAIDNWVAAIEAEDIASKAKQISAAVKGTNKEKEVKSLCQSMTSYVKTLTTKLKDYNARLDEVKKAYAQYDSTASTSITNAKTSVNKMKKS